jgi:hypothetical protein
MLLMTFIAPSAPPDIQALHHGQSHRRNDRRQWRGQP